MIKRGKLNLGQGIFRVSVPNVDVDTATQAQLLLDERVVYPQVIQSIFVPFDSAQPARTVPIINLGFVPRLYAFGRYDGEDNRSFPAKAFYSSNGGIQNHFFVAVDATTLYINFPVPNSVRGAQVITMRP
ncbi:hypothetical protein GCM10011491_31180 [Brucella endophytica]|uniref:Uncharacterized protein n=1 Tax=Brucella endophytica TaxID=1963359 RepID=A0A916WIF4_9HYPH|nr:hypothetical protein [Brucella endophytica]GGB00762.1 hypothetical protein GCM10011491_31180 [Brucella endophytica]